MIAAAFDAVIYNPLYNAVVFLVGALPTHDLGVAVIVLTILVRIILMPLARRAVETQRAMKQITPEVEALKKKYKKNSPEQSQAIFALYKERNIHPFASIGLTFLQLPVLFGLYWVFLKAGFPEINAAILYPFVHEPSVVNIHFLGFMDMTATHNIVLAILVAISQFVYTRLSMGPREVKPESTPVEASLSEDMAKSFDMQARYILPVTFGIISYFLAAAAPLYWTTANVFMIAQELAAGRRFREETGAPKA